MSFVLICNYKPKRKEKMTKHNFIKDSGEEELLKGVAKTPQLARYILNNKIHDVKKNAIIVSIIVSAIAFGCGFMVGMNIFNITQVKSIVEVQVEK